MGGQGRGKVLRGLGGGMMGLIISLCTLPYDRNKGMCICWGGGGAAQNLSLHTVGQRCDSAHQLRWMMHIHYVCVCLSIIILCTPASIRHITMTCVGRFLLCSDVWHGGRIRSDIVQWCGPFGVATARICMDTHMCMPLWECPCICNL